MNFSAEPLQTNSIWGDEPGPWETSSNQGGEPARTVLILDDSRAHRLMLETVFAKWGFKVLQADNGRDGTVCLERAGTIALILTDWKMPSMNGLEFVQAVRAKPEFAAVPIIMMSGLNTMRHISEALQAGVNDYVLKPFSKEDLAAKLRANHIEVQAEPS
jgi:two-component system chemotaxis response regulator CheY